MRARAGARAVLRLKPATSRKPLVAGSRPQSMRNVVVFPAPLGPSRPKISPRRTLNEVLATAVKLPNWRTRSRTLINSIGSFVSSCTDEFLVSTASSRPSWVARSRRRVITPSSRREGVASHRAPRSIPSRSRGSVPPAWIKRTAPLSGTASRTCLLSSISLACSVLANSPSRG